MVRLWWRNGAKIELLHSVLPTRRAPLWDPTSRQNRTQSTLIATSCYRKHAIQTPPAIFQTVSSETVWKVPEVPAALHHGLLRSPSSAPSVLCIPAKFMPEALLKTLFGQFFYKLSE